MINGHILLDHCLVDANNCAQLSNAFEQASSVTCQSGMIFSQKPKFIDAEAGNFSLQYNSPAIDAGNDSTILSATDIIVKPRILLEHTDMGAYEYDGPPPTRISDFDVKLDNDTARISWMSRSEYENAGFQILKNTDSTFLKNLEWIASKGNGTEQRFYSFDDPALLRGRLYYFQLVQVDNDGCAHIVGEDTLFVPSAEILYELSPNPADDRINLKIYLPFDFRNFNFRLINSAGYVVWENKGRLQRDWNAFDFDLSDLYICAYFLQVDIEGEKKVLPFIKVRK